MYERTVKKTLLFLAVVYGIAFIGPAYSITDEPPSGYSITGEPVFLYSKQGLLERQITPRTYPADPTSDIAWSAGMTGVTDIQAAFNAARQAEKSQIGTSIPDLILPSQSEWDAKSDGEKALWLINQERIDRDIDPLQGVEINVTNVAQDYAKYLLDNEQFSHEADGSTPWERLNNNPAINACHDRLDVAENLAMFGTFGFSSLMLTIERSIFNWMYDTNDTSNWGHRHAILWYPYNDNNGDAGKEGFLGIGRAKGAYESWTRAEIIVMNIFDPCADWESGTTPAELPTVSTANVLGITKTSAESGGNIISNGGSAVTARGVCWSTVQNPTTSDNKTSDGSGTGSFTSSISGLTLDTRFYIRAYATNSVGTAYGTQYSFLTLPDVSSKLEWVTSKAEAVSKAKSEGKMILLLAGRELCSRTTYMRDTFCEKTEPAIKIQILRNYVPWFCDIDKSREHSTYALGLGEYLLPLICRIDPNDPDKYLDQTTGFQDADDFYARLSNLTRIRGDINGIYGLDLGDAILALQICAGMKNLEVHMEGEVNEDSRIHLEEAIYVLRQLSAR